MALQNLLYSSCMASLIQLTVGLCIDLILPQPSSLSELVMMCGSEIREEPNTAWDTLSGTTKLVMSIGNSPSMKWDNMMLLTKLTLSEIILDKPRSPISAILKELLKCLTNFQSDKISGWKD